MSSAVWDDCWTGITRKEQEARKEQGQEQGQDSPNKELPLVLPLLLFRNSLLLALPAIESVEHDKEQREPVIEPQFRDR